MSEREYAVVYEKGRAFERSTGNTMSKKDLVEALHQMEEERAILVKTLKTARRVLKDERTRNYLLEEK